MASVCDRREEPHLASIASDWSTTPPERLNQNLGSAKIWHQSKTDYSRGDLIFVMTQLDLYLVLEDDLGQQGWPRFAGIIPFQLPLKQRRRAQREDGKLLVTLNTQPQRSQSVSTSSYKGCVRQPTQRRHFWVLHQCIGAFSRVLLRQA